MFGKFHSRDLFVNAPCFLIIRPRQVPDRLSAGPSSSDPSAAGSCRCLDIPPALPHPSAITPVLFSSRPLLTSIKTGISFPICAQRFSSSCAKPQVNPAIRSCQIIPPPALALLRCRWPIRCHCASKSAAGSSTALPVHNYGQKYAIPASYAPAPHQRACFHRSQDLHMLPGCQP